MYKNLAFVAITFLVEEAVGHGMMLEPPNRSSLWRFNLSDVYNYNDNQNYCGGLTVSLSFFIEEYKLEEKF